MADTASSPNLNLSGEIKGRAQGTCLSLALALALSGGTLTGLIVPPPVR